MVTPIPRRTYPLAVADLCMLHYARKIDKARYYALHAEAVKLLHLPEPPQYYWTRD